MATTAVTLDNFRTTCGECADAIVAEDWALAMKLYAKAEAINAGLEVEGASGANRMRRKETLLGLKQAIETARAVVTQSRGGTRLARACVRHSR